MPQPKYRYRNVERADNTAQIGIRNNRRAIETVENRYKQANDKKAKGTATFKDNRLLDYRNPKSLYTQMRKASGAIKPVYPEFDVLTIGRANGLGSNIGKKASKTASKIYNTSKKYYNTAKSIYKNKGYGLITGETGDMFGIRWTPLNRVNKEPSFINLGAYDGGNPSISLINSGYPGEGRKLYDAAIQVAKSRGKKGIVSGKNLLSAPKTYRTYEHYYPNRIKMSNDGHWENFMLNPTITPNSKVKTIKEFLEKSGKGEYAVLDGAPTYLLNQPYDKVALFKDNLKNAAMRRIILDNIERMATHKPINGYDVLIPGLVAGGGYSLYNRR